MPSFASTVFGLRHPEESVSDVRRTDARRRKRDGPKGVFQGFQVSVYKVDPRLDSLARNLLSKDDWRAALLDEPGKAGPKVSWVRKPSSSACRAERLAGCGTGPNRHVIGPSGFSESKGPGPDSCEEVALCESGEVGGPDIFDRSFINYTRGNVARFDKVAQPLGRVGVNLVVIGGHISTPPA